MNNLTEANERYIVIMAKLFEKTPDALINSIIEADRNKNAVLYERARAADQDGGKLSFYSMR